METYKLVVTTKTGTRFVHEKQEFEVLKNALLHYYAYPDIYGNIKKAIISLEK